MNKIYTTPPPIRTDEIDLIEFAHSLWQQRKLILISTLIVGAIGTIYCLAATKEYEISSLLRPTAINDLDALNRSEVYKLPPTEALNKVGARLDSYDARLGFFRANPKLFESFQKPGQSLEQGFELFNRNAINLFLPTPDKTELSSFIRLKMQYPDGVNGVAILNGFVDYALNLERQEISADLKVIVDNRLAEVQGKIAAARFNYEAEKESKIATLLEMDRLKRAQLNDELKGLRLQTNIVRSNRIAELGEAIAIAKVMGIKHPTTPSSIASANQAMRTEINNQSIPLYFMGTDALEAERAILKQRANDDFTNGRTAEISKELKMLEVNREVEILNQRKNEDIFLQNIESLRAEKARLRSINIEMKNLNLVSIYRRAQEPLDPVKPRKLMIIGISLFAGLFIGIVLGTIRQLMLRRRKLSALEALEGSLIAPQQDKITKKSA